MNRETYSIRQQIAEQLPKTSASWFLMESMDLQRKRFDFIGQSIRTGIIQRRPYRRNNLYGDTHSIFRPGMPSDWLKMEWIKHIETSFES